MEEQVCNRDYNIFFFNGLINHPASLSMAVVSPVPAILQRFNSVRSLQDFGVTRTMTGRGEIVVEANTGVVNDTIYVAVTKDVKESKSNLIWAVQHSEGKKICILHVHVPATMIPLSKFQPYVCL